MSVTDIVRRVGKLAAENSPTILTSIGVVGTITTAYLAGKAAFEASDIIRLKEGDEFHSEEDRRDAREVLKDRFNLTWRLYIPAAGVGVATIACIIGANHMGSRRTAALAGATTILEKTFDEYKKKVVETIGAKKDDAIHAAIAQDRVNENPPPDHFLEEVQLAGNLNKQMCLDLYGSQYFAGSVEGIRRAVNDFNRMMLLSDGFGSLADLYLTLGLDNPPKFSYEVGWTSDRFVEERINTTLLHESIPCITLDFANEPHQDFRRSHRFH